MNVKHATRLPILRALSISALAGVLIGLILALFFAGTDIYQGHVQRIFYVHLAAFSGAVVAFGLTVLGGIAYLVTRQVKWDTLAFAAVEVGFALALVNLVLGSIWARPIWNTWWTGDPRMTSAAIMMLICLAYLLLRHGFEDPEWQRIIASVLGVVLMGSVVVTTLITRIRSDSIHPVVLGSSPQNTAGGLSLSDSMMIALFVNMFVWGLLVTPALIWWRIRLEELAQRVRQSRLERRRAEAAQAMRQSEF